MMILHLQISFTIYINGEDKVMTNRIIITTITMILTMSAGWVPIVVKLFEFQPHIVAAAKVCYRLNNWTHIAILFVDFEVGVNS